MEWWDNSWNFSLFHLFLTVSFLANKVWSVSYIFKRPGREADYSYPSITDVKNVKSLTTILRMSNHFTVIRHLDKFVNEDGSLLGC